MTSTSNIKAQQLWFTAPSQVEIREQVLPAPAAGELLIKSYYSAVSTGTELLVYRGQIPAVMQLDTSLDSLQHASTYPLQYGYACVGQVIQAGEGLAASWIGKLVFSFQPHSSHFIAAATSVILLPTDIEPEAAVFLANMETAVNLVQDGNPALGERVVVLGQGVVGLLLSSLLAQHPLADLLAVDGLVTRRGRAKQMGVEHVYDPAAEASLAALKKRLFNRGETSNGKTGADLIYEVSGAPAALNLAIELSGYNSRIVIGSWYGNKSSTVDLGGEAHRNRLKIITSQVSTIAPELGGRWDKSRRFELSWEMIRRVGPQALITHQFHLTAAPTLYQQLQQTPDDIVQAVFVYTDS